MSITIVNRRTAGDKIIGRPRIYVGRGSPLGNPFRIGEHGTREEVIEKYRKRLKSNLRVGDVASLNAIAEIRHLVESGINVELECFCAPKACHAEVIRDAVMGVLP